MTVYLDNAASTCPKPAAVIAAVDECLRLYCANPGRGAHKTAVQAARVIHAARGRAASFLGIADSANLIFTQNATDALNLALHGLLQPGDHVVTSRVEHNAVERPLKTLSRQGVEVTRVGAGGDGLLKSGDIVAALKPNTRLVVLTHASNITGAIQPVAEIGAALREKDVLFLLDAAQSAGNVPLDMGSMAIDMIACTGHKSLMGPQGIGMLYLSAAVQPRPVRQGGTGTHSTEEQEVLARPDIYEPGTVNTPGIAGLGAGIEFIETEGLEKLAAHKTRLIGRLHEGLAGIDGVTTYGPGPGEPRAPLLAFNAGSLASSETAKLLDRDYDIASRSGLHCAPGAHELMGTLERGAVRLSVGPFNGEDDIDAAISAVREIAAGA